MPRDEKIKRWQQDSHDARLWTARPDGSVQCHLSPRNCIIGEGHTGFCRVRVNRGGELRTLNYGKSVAMTEESIETEAVYHFAPGARILSMGNVGCMMNCDYCHNWKTSQARFVDDDVVFTYTPERVVEEALARGINVISWTYNDPVVWQEFVLDTAALAREQGIVNLYKSAFYISLEAATELADVIDIFSVSIKSMDPVFYKKFTKGRLEPVLEAAEYVFRRGRHVEISNLMVTDANDSQEEARKVAEWVVGTLSRDVPLHYVRFHPDYKYTHVTRTPVDRLEAARTIALETGVKYCYLGNVYDHPAVNSYCPACGAVVVQRYGLSARPVGLDDSARCAQCGEQQPFIMISSPRATGLTCSPVAADRLVRKPHQWRGDVKAVHLEIVNNGAEARMVAVKVLGGPKEGTVVREVPVLPNSRFRFICCKSDREDTGVLIEHPDDVALTCYEVYDRAHFPTASMEEAAPAGDAVPEPVFVGIPRVVSRS
jgi:pyruvate formate lyase activating enzyme